MYHISSYVSSKERRFRVNFSKMEIININIDKKPNIIPIEKF